MQTLGKKKKKHGTVFEFQDIYHTFDLEIVFLDKKKYFK